MKKLIGTWIAIVVFGASLAAHAQDKKLSEEDLKTLVSAATEKRKGLPQRQKVVTFGYLPGESSETLFEFGPNDTFHFVSKRTTYGVATKTEMIRIGITRYHRQKDGSWLKEEPKPNNSGSGSGMGSGSGTETVPPEVTDDIEFVGTERIGKQKTRQYRHIKKVVFKSRVPVLTRFVIKHYWFREDGLMVRESTENYSENSRSRYKSVTDYEYDNDIRIVAPIK